MFRRLELYVSLILYWFCFSYCYSKTPGVHHTAGSLHIQSEVCCASPSAGSTCSSGAHRGKKALLKDSIPFESKSQVTELLINRDYSYIIYWLHLFLFRFPLKFSLIPLNAISMVAKYTCIFLIYFQLIFLFYFVSKCWTSSSVVFFNTVTFKVTSIQANKSASAWKICKKPL